jgi:hypothetical protein
MGETGQIFELVTLSRNRKGMFLTCLVMIIVPFPDFISKSVESKTPQNTKIIGFATPFKHGITAPRAS